MDGITTYSNFLSLHKPQLLSSGVPEHFWQCLCKKLHSQIFDSGMSFQLVEIDYEDAEKTPYDPLWSVIAISDIDHTDPNHIYLIDHAWTFKADSVRRTLRNLPGLLQRMCDMMRINGDTIEDKIEHVAQSVWKFAHTYAIGGNELSVEDRIPVWYVMDELGSGITHSDNPNFRTVPFIYLPDQIAYTLLFPVVSVEQNDFVTRNFIERHYPNSHQREAMLIPWKQYDYFDLDSEQHEPDTTYFIEGHIVESLPNLDLLDQEQETPKRLRVYSEYTYINEFLTAPEFEIVNNEHDADILWYLKHFKTFQELSENSPKKFINQFPFEYVITIKDLLAIVARRCCNKYNDLNTSFESFPPWLPKTFNMNTELPKLVSYYMQRKKAGLNNIWICKPYNLARGLDTYITDNLDFLCRLPLTGPKIAQKYIEDPVLFERPDIGLVKFDIRYVLILRSVNPTEVFVYNNFFLRFSNKRFDLNNFEDYEQHFTVMNYTAGVPLYRMLCKQFKEEWAKQYASYDWALVEKSIFNMISELFTAATMKDVPCGIAKSPQSRALYAADIMLSWYKDKDGIEIQPKLLEINWMPDCQRACHYYPEFYNDIFSVMFLNNNVSTCTKVL